MDYASNTYAQHLENNYFPWKHFVIGDLRNNLGQNYMSSISEDVSYQERYVIYCSSNEACTQPFRNFVQLRTIRNKLYYMFGRNSPLVSYNIELFKIY